MESEMETSISPDFQRLQSNVEKEILNCTKTKQQFDELLSQYDEQLLTLRQAVSIKDSQINVLSSKINQLESFYRQQLAGNADKMSKPLKSPRLSSATDEDFKIFYDDFSSNMTNLKSEVEEVKELLRKNHQLHNL